MKEQWKTIPNFSRYQASTEGNLRSLNYKNTGKIRVLKPAKSTDGYWKTMLKNDSGVYKSWQVHKFVALAFLGERPKNYEIDHVDANKDNNSPRNLEYVTRATNLKRCIIKGLMVSHRGEKNGMSYLTTNQVKEIKSYVKRRKEQGIIYYGRKDLAKKYNCTEHVIKDILRGRTWNHV